MEIDRTRLLLAEIYAERGPGVFCGLKFRNVTAGRTINDIRENGNLELGSARKIERCDVLLVPRRNYRANVCQLRKLCPRVTMYTLRRELS